MAELSTKQRKKLKSDQFALPGGRYPINDESHARNALARVAQNGTDEEKKKVRAAVKRKFPGIEQGSGELTELGQLTLSRFQERYGTGDGHQKFEEAINDGHISRHKMFKEPRLRGQAGKFARKAG